MTDRPRAVVTGVAAVWLLGLSAGCGGGTGVRPAAPPPSASAVVQRFMDAVTDSNLTKMATLWGTTRGPAGTTHQPSDYEKRIVVMQTYLQSEGHRIVSDTPDGSEGRRLVQVELRRPLCTRVVPFTVIRLTDQTWLVNSIDLTAAGSPARPCPDAERNDSARSR